MRVIAGSARGKQLFAPEGTEITRPTTDRVKEAVFGSLQFRLMESRVLDAFSGSGAIGIEALSRGADAAVMIERDKTVAAILKKNLRETRLADRAQVIEADFFTAVGRLTGQFDLIFLDPPYKAGLYRPAIEAIIEHNLLSEDGLILAEHDGTADLGPATEVKCKKYGKTYVSFLTLESEK
ncbi:MAG: 16S rRNA (guanine(966)-N(2))-methyltransferase RsmD [Christensenellaceae bacterium]|nr:16S rRNA (guanine(966)-N(2))-methyltransferase RsmD [Christensenellaceae bacterium]